MSYRYLDPERIMTEAAYWRFPGAAVAAFGEGIEDEYFCTGVRKLGESAPFDENTMFTIASCSKSFTSALAGILADRGLVDLDAPVSSYAPDLQMWDAAATEKMSLKDMLCHRTGFGAHDVIWPAPYSRAEMAKRIRYIEPADAYGSPRALYSNVMYAMAGYVEEAVTGKSWGELLKDNIFTPLGMSRSDGSGKVLAADANHAEPHYYKGGDVIPVPYWNVDQAGPAASVTSTLKDLVRWVKCHAYGGVLPDGRRLISEENFRRIHTPGAAYPTQPRIPHPDYRSLGYCLGWQKGIYRGQEFQRHGGKIEGYSSLMAYLPAQRKGFVALVNLHCPPDHFFQGLFYSLMDRFLGIDASTEPYFPKEGDKAPDRFYHECELDIAAKRLDPALKGAPAALSPDKLTGVYENKGYGTVTVRQEKEKLLLHYRDQELPLIHYGGDGYVMENVLADVLTMRVPVRFEAHPLEEGRAQKLFIGYDDTVRDILFTLQREE